MNIDTEIDKFSTFVQTKNNIIIAAVGIDFIIDIKGVHNIFIILNLYDNDANIIPKNIDKKNPIIILK